MTTQEKLTEILNKAYDAIKAKQSSSHEDVDPVMLQALVEAYNLALDHATESATVYLPSHIALHGTKNIDKQSILKLKL